MSKGGVYSWYEGSNEDNAFLLEKAVFVPREHCTIYLAHVNANPNCKVDIELFRMDIVDVKIPELSEAGKVVQSKAKETALGKGGSRRSE